MSEAQQATQEQQERMEAAVAEAQKRAMQEVQQSLQIELQMRSNALSLAVDAHKGLAPVEITRTATTFLEFLKKGTA